MAKRRRRSFFKQKSLPPDFSRDYVIALRALSRKHKDDSETVKAVKLLKRMSREAVLAGRGEVWMPQPGSTTGHFPVISELPFSKIRTALRKNTLKRERAWKAVASSTRPFFPQHGAVSQLEKSLLPAIITSVPFKKGRSPALLGKRVPGELKMTRSGGSSIIPIRSISPDEWAQHGFQPLKFAVHPALPLTVAATLPWVVGAGAFIVARKKKAARTQKRLAEKGYTLEPVEALIYEKGYQYGLRSFLRRHRVSEKIKRGALPAALSGLVLEGLRRAHTEIGIPPTTVDLVPVQRTTIRGEFAPYTNMQLAGFRSALQNKLAMVDEVTANEIRKQIGKVNVEIIGRRAV